MALTQCSECNRQISDKAAACPQCGCPLSKTEKAITLYECQSSSNNLSLRPETSASKTSSGSDSDTVTLSGCLLGICVILVIGVIICFIFMPHVGFPLLTILALGRLLVRANNK